ncbi:Protein kinase domain [Carpediemonas membranifera]|uniref:non-specific serine/threonine protein kinase n=1 Tax=Carpediemonas membranifera TaxID=201153 RepID=A0A8J6E0I7_9EUKA|nr:Protein kinase domain [Carpediemonas membranifera]|eukprot:KAG9395184.1 Protein kinase domain [Carpediemonas membranifera]
MASEQAHPDTGTGDTISDVRWSRVLAYHDHFVSYYDRLFKDMAKRKKRLKEAKHAMKKLKKEDREDFWLAFVARETLTLRARRIGVTAADFELKRIIGQGGMSNVYLAKYKQTGRYYAMKRIGKYNVSTFNQALRIRSERAVMTITDNPFITKCKFCFQDDAYVYMVMDLAQGGDFAALLGKIGGLSPEDAAIYFAEMVEAVSALHSHGFIHRDLKPSNFLIRADGHLLLADFGFAKGMQSVDNAKVTNKDQLSYSVVGTPEYIAPEVFSGAGYTFSCDLWSLACILYEMLSGAPPFTAATIAMVIAKIQSHDCNDQFICKDDLVDFDDPDNPLVDQAWDLIQRLLCPAASRTITLDDIKAHPFLAGINWDALPRRTDMPFIPKLDGPDDFRYFECSKEVKADEDLNKLVDVDLLSELDDLSVASMSAGSPSNVLGSALTNASNGSVDLAPASHGRRVSAPVVPSLSSKVMQFESTGGNSVVRAQVHIPQTRSPFATSARTASASMTRQRSLSDPKLTPMMDYHRVGSPVNGEEASTPSFITPSFSSLVPYPSLDRSGFMPSAVFSSTPPVDDEPESFQSHMSAGSMASVLEAENVSRGESPMEALRDIGFVTDDAVPDPSRTMHKKMIEMLKHHRDNPVTPDANDANDTSEGESTAGRHPMTIVIKKGDTRQERSSRMGTIMERTPLEGARKRGGLHRPRVRISGVRDTEGAT